MIYICPWKIKNVKLCFLTYVKNGKSNEMLKIPLEGYKKNVQKEMVKYMLYPNIADLINLNNGLSKTAHLSISYVRDLAEKCIVSKK